jgi:hypothetical protein
MPRMKRLQIFGILALMIGIVAFGTARPATQAPGFDNDFTGGTMRVDYFHSGTATEEHISLDRVVADGPWSGSRTRLIDDLNLGKYFFEVADRETNRLLYSRGFSTVYNEWEETAEAKQMFWRRTIHRRPASLTAPSSASVSGPPGNC